LVAKPDYVKAFDVLEKKEISRLELRYQRIDIYSGMKTWMGFGCQIRK